MRLFSLVNAWAAAVGAVLAVLMLGLKDGWPLNVKWERWEYSIKAIVTSAWALWGFWAVYWATR